jgi:transposase
VHVVNVARDERGRLIVTVEADVDVGGGPSCGVVAVGHGRRIHTAADAPCFVAVPVVPWRKRVWRCVEPLCRRARSASSTT